MPENKATNWMGMPLLTAGSILSEQSKFNLKPVG